MIELPHFAKAWDYENGFYLTCDMTRLSKVLAHYELFKQTLDLPGAIVECGVFKGVSLARFAMLRDLFGNASSKQIVGFDTFGAFPDSQYQPDQAYRRRFIEAAGDESISADQMRQVLAHKNCHRHVDLVEGDVCQTVPEYVRQNPHLKISLLNLDTDVYEPAKVILEHLYPRIVRGGVLILDDYGTFPGETQAVDEYFHDQPVEIKKFPFCMTPSYIVKR
ncbi:MAG: TylF/MycF/NovP-related O-methyltransferase [Pirellulaceae bacterium]